jgi:hypothetical protein
MSARISYANFPFLRTRTIIWQHHFGKEHL